MPWLASRSARAVSIVVAGHTYRLGTDGYNQRLSASRAQSVKAYLGPIANAGAIVD